MPGLSRTVQTSAGSNPGDVDRVTVELEAHVPDKAHPCRVGLRSVGGFGTAPVARPPVDVVEDGIRGVFAVYEIQVSTRASHLLVLTGGNRGRRIRLSGAFWNEADLTVIADYAGVSATDQALDVKGFEERVPGIMNPWERHPVAFGVATAFVVVALVVVAVLGFFYLADIPFGSDPTM